MKKIKILRIIARLNIGGPAIHTILLTEGLDKSRFKSLLVCGSIGKDEGDMLYYAKQREVTPIFIPELKREPSLLDDIITFSKIYKIISRGQPDIIHTHTAKAGALGRLATIVYNLLKQKKLKIVHTFHGHIFEGYFSPLKSKVFIFIERFLAHFSSRIITVSESVKRELILLGIANKDKIAVIPLGLELDDFLNLPERNNLALNIGIVGRLVPIKDHRLFLEAATRVVNDNPDKKLRFQVIGDGELRKELERYAKKLNILNYIDFLGWQRDLAGVYSDLDIVALTSINEGTPVSLIEAMASARPVVATEVGGVKDLLGDERAEDAQPNVAFKVLERGIMVNAGDTTAFANALTFMLQHKGLRQDISMCSREFVRKQFAKERLITDMERLYDNIVSPNKPL